PRVFLMSYTHGAELCGLAAAHATVAAYKTLPVIDTMYRQGQRLKEGIEKIVQDRGLQSHFQIMGRPCNLVFAAYDARGQRSQAFRTLFLQELVRGGVLGPSFVVSYSHDNDAVDHTIAVVGRALDVYGNALRDGVDRYLEGPVSKPVFRRFNHEEFS
ncbi:MAG: glutamate-1-semialdehyde 2,1-aminomutase, partial [Planctomycetota bacterium]|nr:glutamate-1-semialdehyde 2,1-aminomutase [Planctomycetota bacterium]